ncbi:FlaD/FlaE family flagellar protein [Haloarchaeobius sp. TZWWS8]|uniref:FlaD/FlaE family flagellar protein n=1 Tax=Haloarchaeobius sp. TZWWS8 TaxID=3446121 RepID=UPI003EBDA65D
MGLKEILTEFLSSGGDRQPVDSTESEDGEDDDEAPEATEPMFDVPLEDLDQEEQIESLEHRIDGLEDSLDSSTGQLETIQGSQQQVAERMEEMNQTVRQLLGIYDQLTANANPFVAANQQPGPSSQEQDGFGVVSPEEQATVPVAAGGRTDQPMSFDDLKGGSETEVPVETPDDLADAPTENEPEDDETDEGPDTFISAEGDGRDATLPDLPDTFATDVIVFEWMTELVTTAGPSAALRAISHYEEVGWISPAVKRHLENVLSAPDLDMIVDPTRDPAELTGDDHADSYEYIMKLDAVQRSITND